MYPLTLLLGCAIGAAYVLLSADGLRTRTGGRIGGDLPAFYAAGLMLRDGQTMQMYDGPAQRAAQAPFLPDTNDGWLHFRYPVFVALAYAPFTMLSFKAAYVIHTTAMILCAMAALQMLRRHAAIVDAYFPLTVAAVLLSLPMAVANFGGQNTAFSLLCVVGPMVALERRDPFAAGLWLGAWMFKPQLALPALLVIAGCYPRVLIGVGASAAALYTAGAIIAGWRWPIWWAHLGVIAFAAQDLGFDQEGAVSLREILAAQGFAPLGWALLLATQLIAMWAARRMRDSPIAVVGIAAAAAVLVAPHAMYYEGGLVAVTVVSMSALVGPRFPLLAAGVWLLLLLQPLRSFLPIPPTTVAVLLPFCFMVWIASHPFAAERSAFNSAHVSGE